MTHIFFHFDNRFYRWHYFFKSNFFYHRINARPVEFLDDFFNTAVLSADEFKSVANFNWLIFNCPCARLNRFNAAFYFSKFFLSATLNLSVQFFIKNVVKGVFQTLFKFISFCYGCFPFVFNSNIKILKCVANKLVISTCIQNTNALGLSLVSLFEFQEISSKRSVDSVNSF